MKAWLLCAVAPSPGQVLSSSSSWPDNLPSRTRSAKGVDCGDGLDPDAGGWPAFSMVPVCCCSFCPEISGSPRRGPISPLGPGGPCWCDVGEEPRAVSGGWRGLLVIRKIMSCSDRIVGTIPHQRAADTLVPVCIAISWSCYMVVVGASSMME